MLQRIALVTCAALAACRSAPSSSAEALPAATAEPRPAPVLAPPADAPAELRAYTLVLIKTGPRSGQLSPEENARAFEGHFSNMGRLAQARQLVVAGPYGATRHDPDLRGIFVLATADRAEADAWGGTDPTTQAGVFVQELHELRTAAPLGAALERDLAQRAAWEAEGKTPQPGEGARPYVLLTAEDGELAFRELTRLLDPEGGVFLLARLDGTRALALLDAASVAEARERFAPELEHLGACTLDDWFASAELARLVGS
jgi:uncharacterized protein YciI